MKRLHNIYAFFIYLFHLPSKPQSKWYRYDERMLCAIGFKATAIPEVIEHVRF